MRVLTELIAACRALHRRWRLRRDPVRYARKLGVRLGEGCRLIAIDLGTFGSEPYLVELGNHVTVTAGVRFITHDGGVWVFWPEEPDLEVIAPIKVGDNVFIGLNTLILPGVTIGDNCVIGAGSVVTRDIPAGMVACGVPARPIKTIEQYREGLAARAIRTGTEPRERRAALLKRRFLQDGRAAHLSSDVNGNSEGVTTSPRGRESLE